MWGEKDRVEVQSDRQAEQSVGVKKARYIDEVVEG